METRPYVQWDLINNFMVDVFKALPVGNGRIVCFIVFFHVQISYSSCRQILIPIHGHTM